MLIRAARADEGPALTEMVLRAKASWGYDAAFMALCRDELTVTPQRLAEWDFWVAEIDGKPAGMIALRLQEGRAVLEDFFVDPPFQGRGVGQALMARFLEACRAAGVSHIDVDADPNAEPIYARLGFVTVGQVPSGSIPGRMLPRMELVLSPSRFAGAEEV